MARANLAIGGFRYWGSMFAENLTPRLIPRQVATSYGTGIFKGDPVKLLSDGSAAIAAAAADNIFGIVAAVTYKNADGVMIERDYVPASTAYTVDRQRTIVMVIPATPFTIFEVDANDGTSITTIANGRLLPWENCDHVATTAGNTNTGRGGYQLNISGHATTALQWRILDISPLPENDVTQNNAKYLVICNKTQNWPGNFSTTGI